MPQFQMNPMTRVDFVRNLERFNEVYQGYIEAIYFTLDEDIPTETPMASEAQLNAMSDCADFMACCDSLALLDRYEAAGGDWRQFGADFFFTRCGHGVGFWDRGRGELGDELTEHAKTWGSVDAYLGDDEHLWLS